MEERATGVCRWRPYFIDQSCSMPGLHEDPDGFCLFHSQKPDKDRDGFRQGIERKLEQGDLDFAGYVFPEAIDLFRDRIFSGDANFASTTFSGEADFFRAAFGGRADFSDATFSVDATFYHATFSGDADLSYAKFSGDSEFSRATFSGDAEFNFATFTGNAEFAGATFSRDAEFAGVTFSRDANFSGARFSGDASFSRARFSGRTDFSGAKFSGEAGFSGAAFSGKADFSGAAFGGKADFFVTTFSGEAYFFNVDLEKAVFRSVDLSDVRFSRAINLDKTRFHNVRRRPNPKGLLLDERKARETKKETDYENAEQVYNQLKRNFEGRKDYYRASQFHYGEMEMRRLAQLRRGSYGQWLLLSLYYWLGGYGERLWKPVVWFIVMILLFAGFYGIAGLDVEYTNAYFDTSQHENIETIRDAISFSRTGFFQAIDDVLLFSLRTATLQRGDVIRPLTVIGVWLQLAETIFGPILIGLAGLAIKRRLQR